MKNLQGLRRNFAPATAKGIFLACALISLVALGLIVVFLLIQGIPAIAEIGLWRFLAGDVWKPSGALYGVWPMIVASLLSTLGALAIGGTIGLFTAMFLSHVAPPALVKVVRPLVQLLAGIPSVVYGFFGIVVVVPWIMNAFGGFGNSLLAVILILSAMILPTMITVGETALRAVPKEYQEGSLALGASPMYTLIHVTFPAAKSGLLAAFMLGMGRAIGETMAVSLVAGNRAMVPKSILDPVRTLTSNIATEMSYASGLQEGALYGTGVVLLVFVLLINLVAGALMRQKKG